MIFAVINRAHQHPATGAVDSVLFLLWGGGFLFANILRYINEVPCLSLSFLRAKNALEKAVSAMEERRKEGRAMRWIILKRSVCVGVSFVCLIACFYYYFVYVCARCVRSLT